MPEPQDIQKQTDRDILVDVRAELRHVKENVAEMKVDFRDDINEIKNEQRAMKADIEELRRNQDRAQGGVNLGRWVVSLLPFSAMSAAAGWFIRDR